MNLFKQGIYGTYYFINKAKRLEKNDLVSTNPDLPRIISLWNILENKYILKTFENVPLILPSIRVNKKIGIPMLDRPIMTRENINYLRNFQKPTSEQLDMRMIEDFEVIDYDQI
jgi:hypothetical protein